MAMVRALVAMIGFALASLVIEHPARVHWLEVGLVGAVIFFGSMQRSRSEVGRVRISARESLLWALLLFVPIAFLMFSHS